MPLVAERINKLTEAVPMLGFLFVAEADFSRHDELEGSPGRDVVKAAYDALSASTTGAPPPSTEALRAKLSTSWGSSPASPSARCGSPDPGRKISPPLFESLELLGRERSIARLHDAMSD